jgi:hypothetical protein
MDHETAEKTQAADRYLLDEFSPGERSEFEAHFFDCVTCADKVRIGSIFIDNAREVMKTQRANEAPSTGRGAPKRSFWSSWLTPAALAPSFAAICLAAVVGYQNLITLPDLKKPQLLSTSVIAPFARDAAPVVKIDPRLPRFNLNFLVDSPKAYSNYICQFRNENGSEILTIDSGARDVSTFTLSFLLRPEQFPSGRYELILRPQSDPGVVAQRYTFVVDRGGS